LDTCPIKFGSAGFMRQAFFCVLLPTLVLFLAPSVGGAQVTTSITSTTGAGNLSTTITHTGNLYDITGGTRPGNGPNLFHSFGDFSVGAGDVGNFLNTPVNGSLPVTSNILSRVIGGHISNIYGTIQTAGFEPDSPIRRARR
jgi:filamentous hemagglutinin family protein